MKPMLIAFCAIALMAVLASFGLNRLGTSAAQNDIGAAVRLDSE